MANKRANAQNHPKEAQITSFLAIPRSHVNARVRLRTNFN